MGVSPESGREKPVDFRAPPPSPVASGRRSCVTNDDVLTEFLESSLRVPDLVLPDKIFPKQKFIENPSSMDFGSLGTPGSDSASRMLDSIARVGCFQLVNHGIGRESSHGAMTAAAGIFLVPPEKRAAAMRSPEKPYGFEEVHGSGEEEDGSELAEEFVWSREEGLEAELQRVWPLGYSNFRDEMVKLQSHVEKIAERVMTVLWEQCLEESTRGNDGMKGEGCAGADTGTMCCILKHSKNVLDDDRWASSLRYDVIRMMIRGADYSHALCLHLCDGASEFHVYSKKGWVSFCPDKHSLIVTVGDQFQALSGGRYKHVVGRPIFKSETEDRISMAFLCSPPQRAPASNDEERCGGRNTVSVGQQVMAAIVLSLAYHLFLYILNKF
ncbi:hypothetical protein EUGRSUZ_F03071 [Eucalyptus grandis]|uniref:Uncharacterized protein n=2 Tax=Eucalyptus grandis TaxID=71139 RepID=A0ACC3KKZ9_EUCGR|nr:hypothetical protein EUGRSUZ_F03071 [Eucalyptus grandis]